MRWLLRLTSTHGGGALVSRAAPGLRPWSVYPSILNIRKGTLCIQLLFPYDVKKNLRVFRMGALDIFRILNYSACIDDGDLWLAAPCAVEPGRRQGQRRRSDGVDG